jgi:hypothetical protein
VKLLFLICGIGAACPCVAQPVRFYSEFRRISSEGQIVRQDATGEPREIISPPVLRGMHLSYRIVIATPPGQLYWMYVGANPEELIDHAVYREMGAGAAAKLEPVKLPVSGTLATPNTVHTYWLDLFIPRTTPERRIRFEIQVNFDSRWVIYPLEVRVLPGQMPEIADIVIPAAAPRAASSETSRGALNEYLCGPAKPATPSPKPRAQAAALIEPSQSEFLSRNARQDLAMARAAESRIGKEAVLKGLFDALETTPKAWCVARPGAYNPDLILRARDFLIRNAPQ